VAEGVLARKVEMFSNFERFEDLDITEKVVYPLVKDV
jgi:hypothetical protein